MLEKEHVRLDFRRILEQQPDIGAAKIISNWLFEPSNIFLWHVLTKRRRTAGKWVSTRISPVRDRCNIEEAWAQDAVVLGHDALGKPWLWPDRVRVIQGIVLGQTGSGKTTLLRNIIT